MKYLVCALSLSFAFNAISSDELIIIAGVANRSRYPNVSRHVFDIYQETDQQPTSVIVGGYENHARRWDEFPIDIQRITDANGLERNLNTTFEGDENKNPKDFMLFINDHGSSPAQSWQPMTSSIYVPGSRRFSHSSLMETLDKHPEHNYKVVGVHCYGGGIHSVAFQRDNICTASASSWDRVHYSDTQDTDMALYAKGFYEEKKHKRFDLNKDGETSMFEAHLAGTFLDHKNIGFQQLSSMAYVDATLNKGAYRHIHHSSHLNATDDTGDIVQAETLRTENMLLAYSDNSRQCLENEADGLIRWIKNVNNVVKESVGYPSRSDLRVIPRDLKTIYRKYISHELVDKAMHEELPQREALKDKKRAIIDEWYVREDEMEALQKEHDELNQRISEQSKKGFGIINSFRINSIESERKKIEGKIKNIDEELRAEYTRNIEEIDYQIASSSAAVGSIKHFIQHIKRTAEFMRVATDDQKKKYLNLLKCEAGTI